MYIRSSTTEFGLSVNIYLTSLLSISISCTIFSMLLYLLNISKFKNVNERMKFPLKINRAAFLFNMFLAGMLWQILILIEIHNKFLKQQNGTYSRFIVHLYIRYNFVIVVFHLNDVVISDSALCACFNV